MRGREIAAALQGRAAKVDLESKELERLQRSLMADVERLNLATKEAEENLAETLVPTLDPVTLDRVAKAIRVRALANEFVQERMAKAKGEAQAKLTKLRADLRYVRREALDNELSIAIDDAERTVAPLRQSTMALEAAPVFLELLEYRYGTETYAIRFWQSLYYRHWKYGDLVVEAFGPTFGVETFADIAGKYVEERAARRTLEDHLATLNEAREALATLLADVEALEAQLRDMVPTTLKNVHFRILNQLRPLKDEEIFQLLAGEGDATVAFKRVIGTKKQAAYVKDLADQARESSRVFRSELGKIQRKAAKLRRPKNANRMFARHEADRTIGVDKSDKWAKRRSKMTATRDTVVRFEHYERYDPRYDFLWWDVMSDGRVDGNFITEVRSNPSRPRREHPQSTPLSMLPNAQQSFVDDDLDLDDVS